MANFLQAILDHLKALWPVRIIDADCQGVRFTIGKHVSLLQPGLHFFCPGLQEIEEVAVAYQEIDCSLQSMQTSDDLSVTFSANVGYEIKDAVKWRIKVHHFDGSIERAARGYLGDLINQTDYETIRSHTGEFGDQVRVMLQKKAKLWGVKIVSVHLADFVKARQYRFLGNETPIL
jgi:regulator of protease activity HflC (stomatin/prohibitin superfamily)